MGDALPQGNCPEVKQLHLPLIPHVFEIRDNSEARNPLPWRAALTTVAIIIGAMLELVAMNEGASSEDPQVTVGR